MKHDPLPLVPTTISSSFAGARNDWLNAFGHLELETRKCLVRVAGKDSDRGTPLSQRLCTLAGTPASPRCSKVDAAKLSALKEACEPLLRLRASIVHSVMAEGYLGAEPVAFFQNLADVTANVPVFTVLTAQEFERTRKDVLTLARQFAAISPSSRLRPETAAAGGP